MFFKLEKKDIIENLSGLLIVIVVIFVGVYFLDFSNIQEKIIAAGIWAPIILILAKASTLVFAPLSGSPLYPVAGALFGFGEGLLYIVLGDALGSAISFLISRKLGQKIVERFLSKRNMPTAQRIINIMETTKGFLFARICFSPMPEIVSYAAGLTRISFWKFFTIHNLVGIIPSVILVGGGYLLISSHYNSQVILFVLIAGIIGVAMGGFLFWKYSNFFQDKEDTKDSEDLIKNE